MPNHDREPSEPLKVAQVAPSIFPVPPLNHGGTERVIHDLSVELQALGCEVTLFAPSDSTCPVPRVGALPSLQFLEKKYDSVPPSIPSVLETVRMEEVRRALSTFDIVHFHGEFFHAVTLGEKRKTSLTTIHWRVDELDRELFFSAFPDLPVAAISHAQEQALPKSNRAGIVLHGVDPARFKPNDTPEPYLAFIGRMTDQKRPDVAIRVAQAAGRPIRLAGTVDVGNPLYFDTYVRPGLSPTAEYIGPVDDVAKNVLLRGASALLFPIDWPEPFGLVMIEAMACGTPVIAWNRGSVPEVVEHGVTGFIVDSEEEAVAAIGQIDRLDRRAIRERFEQRFTARRMAQDYLEIYRRLLQR
ncbi:glycosyltransferase involved in cell wall biosynthesis [Rhizobium sp. PP-F2F-G38]|uniref:Glycosyltransferase family 4 protein n=1 Tax=Ferranicluibacter rubi TaxID=2715133 RepID=A0AA44CBJ3_9HYPH|nr:glycosyltransferase family 4 protein [Ferranicluibacter rubi]NHT77088.1 glycosyltransferase family 4 protein [Ferranicluibacter rubi]PYE31433.1 glycosyltransferase involved in cell wall biosynthesis [Rhizobium sp. PP-WC-1G-195]PYE93996.1 glycosyltransferase involved in cell wall biosynthesis [Rhizobium sp. PP-F2F-G38]